MDAALSSPSGFALRQPTQEPPRRLERAAGTVRVTCAARDGATRLTEAYQSGAGKVRFPNRLATDPLEAILINTAGGVTGGDQLSYAVSVGPAAACVATTQAAERIYRRSHGVARIATELRVDGDGSLHWLPQETIVFDSSALARSLSADVDPTGELIAVEAIVLGRAAMGESTKAIAANETWRIRRGGRPVFADGLRLDGDSTAILAGPATGAGATAFATLVLVAPDAEARIDAARAALAGSAGDAGASAWNGMLVARLTAPTGKALRRDLIRLAETLRGAPLPRVWHC